MNSLKTLVTLVFLALIISCNTEPSLQKYIVDNKENPAFISVDLPSSIIKLKNTEVSEDIESTLKTIQKINFLALQLTDSTEAIYTLEKEKVKTLLKNPKYSELFRFHKGKNDVVISYLGNETSVDEVIIFGSENTKGFVIIRILVNDMNLVDILKISKDIQLSENSEGIGQIEDFIKNMY